MILPLRSTREVWMFDWFDLDVPIQFGSMFILPTCLYIVHRDSRLLLGHEFVRELDQRRVELFLHRIFQERGSPDELLVPDLDEWDEIVWQGLSREYQCQINLIDVEPTEEGSREAESIESQLSNLIAGSAENLLATHGETFVAQGLVKAVHHTRSREKRRALLAKALELSENLPEALVELADLELQDGNVDSAGEKFANAAANSVGFHVPGESSCYIRALHGQVLTAWQRGDLAQAIQMGEHLLNSNPIDHPGIRFLIPLLQLLAGQIDESQEYFSWYQKNYPNDIEDPGFQFVWALSLVDRDEEKAAAEKYRRGMIQNLYLAPLLLDIPEPAPDIWQHNDRGDIQYAADFLNSFGLIWERDAAAVRFLREVYTDSNALLEQLIVLRRKMAEFQDHRYEPKHREIWQQLIEQEQALIKSGT